MLFRSNLLKAVARQHRRFGKNALQSAINIHLRTDILNIANIRILFVRIFYWYFNRFRTLRQSVYRDLCTDSEVYFYNLRYI